MISIENNKLSDTCFCLFLLLCGLGNYYNELFQIGGVIVPADIGLALFVMSVIITQKGLYISRNHVYLIVVFMTMLILGIDDSVGDILRDVKVFIYFFAAYFYCNYRNPNKQFVGRTLKTFMIIITFTIIACTVNFLTYGLSGLSSNQIKRTFGLGIAQLGLAVVFIIFLSAGEYIRKYIGSVCYYMTTILSLFLMILSYTRTVWLLLVVGLIGYLFSNLIFVNHSIELDGRKVIRGILTVLTLILALYLLYYYLTVKYPQVINLLFERFKSIIYAGTGESYNGQEDTLEYRLSDILTYKDKFSSPLIILGWGFGDKKVGAVSSIVENSFLYYAWKYGLIWGSVLVFKVIGKFRIMFKRKNAINNAVACSLISFFAFAGMSGHLNKYYYLPMIAFFFVIDLHQYFVDDKELSFEEAKPDEN